MQVNGIAIKPGVTFGEALHFNTGHKPLDYRILPIKRIPQQLSRLDGGLARLKQQLTASLQALDSHSDAYALVEADLLYLDDPDLRAHIADTITQLQFSACVSIERVFAHQASELEALDDPYLAQRAEDVRSLGKRLIQAVFGQPGQEPGKLKVPTILLADDISPAEFAVLPLDNVAGIVLKSGGLTSHTAILARAAGIPALLSCPYSELGINNGDQLAIDGDAGALYRNPEGDTLELLRQHEESARIAREQLDQYRDKPAMTLDGHEISLLANVGNLNDVLKVSGLGADGIGLLRTEFMLMHSATLPDERAQYQLYSDAIHALEGRVLTIRTLDIGADKELPCLCQVKEENPALGLRGIRYTLANPQLLKTQLRAVLRAANHGHVRLMFPMVNQVEELDAVLALLETCRRELDDEEKGFGDISLGIVVETPAAVLNLPAMLPMLDFVSIGTNDLTQYAMAADRGNPCLARDYPALSPAVLRLISMTLQSARSQDVKVSLCGEMGSDPRLVPLLIGLGFDELSVNVGALLEVKAAICRQEFSRCTQLAGRALMADRLSELDDCISSYK
ncbi:phosphoenolpyruvate--protein phosphotransferase [Shewanella litorisediminis]|uniref:Phosphoenolpyruvate-protein phosphotransferase n=1 Tax=Shewanella litorisediminis TaxID=1173586 RepID=A0ABX7G823_9GAMM|nr:phosphoenolpyruvate--protein phosphotransferase [Shewanella litorisediminis]MCL2919103.1 phosphoenolpyruvate--protein phosphotransferase [Shewanella litorisediminis]QRH03357.1 phosphoenolpyruvate--protein phosphotransferase [Shewanella litorisediminis]